MKVFITLKSTERVETLGGVGMYYLALRKHLPSSVEYFHFSDDKSTSLLKKTRFRIRDIFIFIKTCKKKNHKPDIIHLNPSISWAGLLRDGLFLTIASWTKKRTLVFFRGWHEYMVRRIDRNRIIRYFFKNTYRKVNTIIVLSVAFKDKLREWGFTQPIYIETTVVEDKLVSAFKIHQASESTNKVNILFLARMEKYKGVFETLEAYKKIKNKNPQVSLTIAGDGSQLYTTKQLVTTQGIDDVYFTGYVTGEKKAQVFADSNIYLFPSYGEGMPNSVLEAMAFGLPVVSRPVGGLNDFFINGKMGYLTESKDPKVFAELIEKLIVNPELRKEISAYNAAFARKHFMASNVAKRLENIYKEVLEGKAKGGSWMSTTN